MILAPTSGYSKALCIKTYKIFDNESDMDQSIIKGTWYDVRKEYSDTDNSSKYLLVRFGIGLVPHLKANLKTESELRDDKIKSILS